MPYYCPYPYPDQGRYKEINLKYFLFSRKKKIKRNLLVFTETIICKITELLDKLQQPNGTGLVMHSSFKNVS